MKEKPLVLVVDPEPGFQRVMNLQLESSGYEVKTASTVQEAVQKLEQKPDVIISSLEDLETSGLVLLDKVREQSVPVIFTTYSEETGVAVLESGADDFLVKPFSLEVLTARVKALLRRVSFKRMEKVG